MEKKPDMQEIIDMFEKPIVDYVQDFMKRLGVPVDRSGAENIVSNVGLSIFKRKSIADNTP